MKLEVIKVNDSRHKRIITKSKKDIGMLFLDIDGSYYYIPNNDSGTFSSNILKSIAELLDETNKAFDEQVERDLAGYKSSTFLVDEIGKGYATQATFGIGSRVAVKKMGQVYSTYYEMFKELGFINPKGRKNITSIYPKKADVKDVVFTIFNKGKHVDDGCTVYAIRDIEGNEFLFNKKGLRPL